MSSDKFCLRWNDFEKSISSSLHELRDDKDFFDVTLACADEQIQAHKVILSACSPFFRNVLKKNIHQHPLLYLKGVKYNDLQSVLNFMYYGEVSVAQEELNSFLSVAEDLKVKGLTQNEQQPLKSVTKQKEQPQSVYYTKSVTTQPKVSSESLPSLPVPSAKTSHPRQQNEDDDIQEVVEMTPDVKREVSDQQQINHTENQVDTYQEGHYEDEEQNYGDYAGEDVNDYNDHSSHGDQTGQMDANKLTLSYIKKEEEGGPGGKSIHRCVLCGKTGSDRSNLRKHVESVHFPSSFQFDCRFCGKVFKAKNNLYVHISNVHRDQNKTF